MYESEKLGPKHEGGVPQERKKPKPTLRNVPSDPVANWRGLCVGMRATTKPCQGASFRLCQVIATHGGGGHDAFPSWLHFFQVV